MYSIRPTWEPISNYAKAKERYESIEPIKFKKQDNTDHYGEDCRPLGRRNAPWMRIEKGAKAEGTGFSSPVINYFDCILYRTVMVRYYEDGRIVVAPNGIEHHNHTLSSAKFLDYTLPYPYYCIREAGRLVVWTRGDNPVRGVVPCNDGADGDRTLELDLTNKGFKNALPVYRLTCNRRVTKLRRKEVEPLIDQAYALAAIIDGAEVQTMDRVGTELGKKHKLQTVEGIFQWMKENFSFFRGFGNTSGQWPARYARVFSLPDRRDFNAKFFPVFYWNEEHWRDVEKDESLFDLVEIKSDQPLRGSRKWYGLHSQDPRIKTHPNIL